MGPSHPILPLPRRVAAHYSSNDACSCLLTCPFVSNKLLVSAPESFCKKALSTFVIGALTSAIP